jgi:hypothetical protein
LKEQLLLSKQKETSLLKPNPLKKGGDNMKKQKLFAILFCCALLIGVSSVAANAQELAGTTYRLYIYPTGTPAFNADATFQSDGVLIIGIGNGVGSYFESTPFVLGTYRALGVTIGDATGDLTMFLFGTSLNESRFVIGLGTSNFAGEIVPFWYYGTLILTEE